MRENSIKKAQSKKTEDICLEKTNEDLLALINKIREPIRVYYESDSLCTGLRDLVIFLSLLISCRASTNNLSLYESVGIRKSVRKLDLEIDKCFKQFLIESKL